MPGSGSSMYWSVNCQWIASPMDYFDRGSNDDDCNVSTTVLARIAPALLVPLSQPVPPSHTGQRAAELAPAAAQGVGSWGGLDRGTRYPRPAPNTLSPPLPPVRAVQVARSGGGACRARRVCRIGSATGPPVLPPSAAAGSGGGGLCVSTAVWPPPGWDLYRRRGCGLHPWPAPGRAGAGCGRFWRRPVRLCSVCQVPGAGRASDGWALGVVAGSGWPAAGVVVCCWGVAR